MSEEHRTPLDPDLRRFLEGAGRSMSLAGSDLAEGIDFQTNMIIASAELEARVALEADAKGSLRVHPISARDLESKISSAALSTLRVQFVTTAPEPADKPGKVPTKDPGDVVDEVRGRTDIARLEEILGRMKVSPTFVPESGRWLVTVTDPEGRLVREIVLPDERRE